MKFRKLKDILALFGIGGLVALGIGVLIVSLSNLDEPMAYYGLFVGVVLIKAPLIIYWLRKRIRY